MPTRTVSLSNDLHLAMVAIGGAQRLARHILEGYADDPEGVVAIDAMLVIVRERLRLLDRAVRGTVDPRLAWCAENDAKLTPGDPTEDDVRLEA